MRQMTFIDPVTLNLWYPIVAIGDAKPGIVGVTRLLEQAISFALGAAGQAAAWKSRPDLRAGDAVDVAAVADPLPVITAYGYMWTSLGNPPADFFPIPRICRAGPPQVTPRPIGVNVSAPRAIENFLDMGHFPYVHTDILGVEPHTEVKEYDVEISDGARRDRGDALPLLPAHGVDRRARRRRGRIHLPRAASLLLRALQIEPGRRAAAGRDRHLPAADGPGAYPRAHAALRARRRTTTTPIIRRFQQMIFGQDKPILENQFPKRLPLDPRAETPIRADKSAIAYRRWLSQKGITYGVIPAAA